MESVLIGDAEQLLLTADWIESILNPLVVCLLWGEVKSGKYTRLWRVKWIQIDLIFVCMHAHTSMLAFMCVFMSLCLLTALCVGQRERLRYLDGVGGWK